MAFSPRCSSGIDMDRETDNANIIYQPLWKANKSSRFSERQMLHGMWSDHSIDSATRNLKKEKMVAKRRDESMQRINAAFNQQAKEVRKMQRLILKRQKYIAQITLEKCSVILIQAIFRGWFVRQQYIRGKNALFLRDWIFFQYFRKSRKLASQILLGWLRHMKFQRFNDLRLRRLFRRKRSLLIIKRQIRKYIMSRRRRKMAIVIMLSRITVRHIIRFGCARANNRLCINSIKSRAIFFKIISGYVRRKRLERLRGPTGKIFYHFLLTLAGKKTQNQAVLPAPVHTASSASFDISGGERGGSVSPTTSTDFMRFLRNNLFKEKKRSLLESALSSSFHLSPTSGTGIGNKPDKAGGVAGRISDKHDRVSVNKYLRRSKPPPLKASIENSLQRDSEGDEAQFDVLEAPIMPELTGVFRIVSFADLVFFIMDLTSVAKENPSILDGEVPMQLLIPKGSDVRPPASVIYNIGVPTSMSNKMSRYSGHIKHHPQQPSYTRHGSSGDNYLPQDKYNLSSVDRPKNQLDQKPIKSEWRSIYSKTADLPSPSGAAAASIVRPPFPHKRLISAANVSGMKAESPMTSPNFLTPSPPVSESSPVSPHSLPLPRHDSDGIAFRRRKSQGSLKSCLDGKSPVTAPSSSSASKLQSLSVHDHPVLDLRPAQPLTVSEDITVQEAVHLMVEKANDAVLVIDKAGFLSGIFTDIDLIVRVLSKKRDLTNTLVKEVMTSDPKCIRSFDSVSSALEMMTNFQIRHLPVLSAEGSLLGVLEIAKCLIDAVHLFSSKKQTRRQRVELFASSHCDVSMAMAMGGGRRMSSDFAFSPFNAALSLSSQLQTQTQSGASRRVSDSFALLPQPLPQLLPQPLVQPLGQPNSRRNSLNDVDGLLSDSLIPNVGCVTIGAAMAVVSPRDRVGEALAHMAEVAKGLVVLDGTELVGILTPKDILRKLATAEGEFLFLEEALVGDIMSPNPICVPSDMGLVDVLQQMYQHRFLHLPVKAGESGLVVGLVTVLDVMCAMPLPLPMTPLSDTSHGRIWRAVLDDPAVVEKILTPPAENRLGVTDPRGEGELSAPVTLKGNPDSAMINKTSKTVSIDSSSPLNAFSNSSAKARTPTPPSIGRKSELLMSSNPRNRGRANSANSQKKKKPLPKLFFA